MRNPETENIESTIEGSEESLNDALQILQKQTDNKQNVNQD